MTRDLLDLSIAAVIILLCLGLAGNDDYENAVAHDSFCAANPKSIACRGE